MPVPPAPLPNYLANRPFATRTSVIAAQRLRRRDLRAPHRGVRVVSSESRDLIERCRDLLPALPLDAAFSHTTAARLLGMPLPPGRLAKDDLLHVAVPRIEQPPRLPGVVGHETSAADVVDVHGLRVTGPIATWCALATSIGVPHLVAAADRMVAAGTDDVDATLERLAVAAAVPRRRHALRLRAAVPQVRPGTRSAQETLLRLAIVDAGISEPLVNHRVHAADGRFVAEVDLAFEAERLAIEYEGAHHLTDPAQWATDIRRREALEHVDWSLLRVTADDLMANLPTLLLRIRTRLRRRTPTAQG